MMPGEKGGSPPHTRGKARARKFSSTAKRITPAHAGKSIVSASLLVLSWDHPRTRGEKLTLFLKNTMLLRITPAHAGKSGRSGAHWCDREDHPRTRGEKRFRLTTRVISPWITPAHAGKSPRCGFIGNSPWDTPAHAGKRLSAVCPDVRHGDHPRTRGEKLNSSLDGLKILGSPPHTRGKAVFRGSIAPGAGITPAHAGKRMVTRLLTEWNRDHPRTRGEKVPV